VNGLSFCSFYLAKFVFRNAAPLGQDGRSHIRQQFESHRYQLSDSFVNHWKRPFFLHRSAKDLDQIEHLLADGKRFEKQLRDMRILSGE
jgi:hypothetical protein